MLRKLPLIAAAVLLAACNPDEIVSHGTPTSPMVRLANSAEPPQEALATAYVRTFTRNAGPPDSYTETLDLRLFEGRFRVTITNGDGTAGSQVRAGSISLNGVQLLSGAELAGSTTSFVFTFNDAPASLSMTLAGPPSGFVRVSVEGHPRRWRVCPGETIPRTYATVQEAVSAADPGATIWVCDGVHYAAALVDKPLTIRPEHIGAATLRDTLPWSPDQQLPNAGGPAPVFWVDGVSSGTFRVVGFNMLLRQSAVVATGTWTRVELDSLTITSVDSARTFAVRAFPGGGESTLELTRSSITGVATGVLAAGGTVNVSESSFANTQQGVVYTRVFAPVFAAARGRVHRSSFGSCALGGCIRIVGPGGVTVSDNTIDKPAGSAVGSGIQIRTADASPPGIAHLPITIINNRISGPAVSATPHIIQSWVLAGGIQVLTTNPDVAPSHITIAGNRVSTGGAGIAVNSANGSVIEAYDNVFDNVYQALRRNGNNPAVNGTDISNVDIYFRRNDVTNAVSSFGAFDGEGILDLTCNWWGSAAGPVNQEWQGGSDVYTPWATEPIAGRAGVSCP